MKRIHVTLLIGVMILLTSIKVLLIYSIVAYSTTVRIALSSSASFENLTAELSSTVSISPSETTAMDRKTRMPATQSKMPITHFIMAPILFTALSTRFTTQKYITSTMQLSSSEMIPSDLTTDAKEITMNTTETIPITTILPTISTTLATNEGTSEISVDTVSTIPIATSKIINTITVETDRMTMTTAATIKDTMTNTRASETTLTKKSSTTSTTILMPNSKCTKANSTIYCTKSIVPEFDYIVRDIETGMACVLTNMMIRINFQYAMKDSQIGNAILTVPTNAKTTGICDEKIAKMTLSWKEPVENQVNGDTKENRITFHYAHNETKFFLDFISIDVHLDDNNFPRAQKKRMRGNTADRHLQLFSALIKYEIFICKVNTTINIGDEIDVVISDIRLIAFNECIQNCSKTKIDRIVETRANINVIVGSVTGIIFILILICKWRRRRSSKKKDSEGSQDIANYFLSCGKIVIKK